MRNPYTGRFEKGNTFGSAHKGKRHSGMFTSETAKIAYQAAVDKIALKCCCGTYRAKQILWKQISGQWDGIHRPYVDRAIHQKVRRRGGKVSE